MREGKGGHKNSLYEWMKQSSNKNKGGNRLRVLVLRNESRSKDWQHRENTLPTTKHLVKVQRATFYSVDVYYKQKEARERLSSFL